MTRPDEYAAHLLDLLRPMALVQTTPYFGGIALKLNGRQFGMVMNGRLYFVVDDRTRRAYEQAGSKPFSYTTKKARVDVRRYFEVPSDAQEDPTTLRAWASDAFLAAGAVPRTSHT